MKWAREICVVARLVLKKNIVRPMATASHPPSADTGIFKFPKIPESPFSLFKTWYDDHAAGNNHISANSLCLSTATKDGRVSSRNLILRRLDEDGFVIMTDARSKKCRDLEENPYAAMTFVWIKAEKDGPIHSRQVRVEGNMEMLGNEETLKIFNEEPLFCKLRAYVCHQGAPVEWDELKNKHDSLLKQHNEGKLSLEKPDHVVGYKLYPAMIEFYETLGPAIADRVMYLPEGKGWTHTRITA